jgi:hypothetical protein
LLFFRCDVGDSDSFRDDVIVVVVVVTFVCVTHCVVVVGAFSPHSLRYAFGCCLFTLLPLTLRAEQTFRVVDCVVVLPPDLLVPLFTLRRSIRFTFCPPIFAAFSVVGCVPIPYVVMIYVVVVTVVVDC